MSYAVPCPLSSATLQRERLTFHFQETSIYAKIVVHRRERLPWTTLVHFISLMIGQENTIKCKSNQFRKLNFIIYKRRQTLFPKSNTISITKVITHKVSFHFIEHNSFEYNRRGSIFSNFMLKSPTFLKKIKTEGIYAEHTFVWFGLTRKTLPRLFSN